MNDLDERLRAGLNALAEQATPESTADEVVERLRAQRHRSGATGRRWLVPALAAAVAVVLAVGAMVVLADGGDDETDVRVGPGPTEVDDTWDPQSLGPGWHDLPAGPLGTLSPRAMVWTGDELIVWRGESTVAGAGIDRAASFDPVTMTWTELPPDPLDVDYLSGEGTGGVWTGTETLFWTADSAEVVAWNPATDTWRASTPPPGPHTKNGVWTGDELVFWADGMAYDPDADTWREIARPSEFLVDLVNDYDSHGLVWTGAEIVVVGVLTGAYDVATDSWREFGPILDEDPAQPGVAWDSFTAGASFWDGQVVVFDGSPTAENGSTTAAVLDLDTGAWAARTGLAPPLQSSEGWPDIVPFDNGRVLVRHAGEVYLRNADGTWTVQPPSQPGAVVGTGDAAFVYGSRETGPFFQVFVPPSEGTAPVADGEPVTLAPGWNDLGADPVVGRSNPILVYGDDKVFVWGGEVADETPVTDGSAYDVASGEWRMLPDFPFGPGSDPGAAWTGDELVVWSGLGVAMLAPDDDAWRTATWPPPRYPSSEAVWVGDRIVWFADGLAYVPGDDEWIETALPPVTIDSPRAAVEGDRLAVLGMAIPGDRLPFTVVFEYSVVGDVWRELPVPADLSAGTTQLTYNEGTLIAADYDMRVRRLPNGASEWTALPDVPLRFYEDYLVPYSVGKFLVAQHAAGFAVLDGTDAWTPVPRNGVNPLLGTDIGLFGYGSAYAPSGVAGRLLAFVPSPLGADGRYPAPDSFVLGTVNYLPNPGVVVERWSTEQFGAENRIIADITSPSGASCRAVATYQPGAVEGVLDAAASESGAQRTTDAFSETVLVPDAGSGARFVWTPLDQGSDTVEFFCPDTDSLTAVIQGLQPVTS
jgi:hypothetical protein